MSLRIGRLSTSRRVSESHLTAGSLSPPVSSKKTSFDGRVIGEFFITSRSFVRGGPVTRSTGGHHASSQTLASVLGTDTPSLMSMRSALTSHDWPGNVRELVNLARRLALRRSHWRRPVLRMLETNPFAPTRTESTTTETDVVEEISLEELSVNIEGSWLIITFGFPGSGINRRTLQRSSAVGVMITNHSMVHDSQGRLRDDLSFGTAA